MFIQIHFCKILPLYISFHYCKILPYINTIIYIDLVIFFVVLHATNQVLFTLNLDRYT